MMTKNQNHKFSVEVLTHFQCGACGQWFTISGFTGVAVSCPVCSVSASLEVAEPIHKKVQAEIAKARQAALEEAAQIAVSFRDPLPLNWWTVSERDKASIIAEQIRALISGAGNHASQQPHATDAATAPRG